MKKREVCYTDDFTRNYIHPTKDVIHIFQFHKRDETWDKLKRVLLIWEERNKVTPKQLLAIIHSIHLWNKVKLTQPPMTLPTPVANELKNKSKIFWLQAPMGLLSHYSDDIKKYTWNQLVSRSTSKDGYNTS